MTSNSALGQKRFEPNIQYTIDLFNDLKFDLWGDPVDKVFSQLLINTLIADDLDTAYSLIINPRFSFYCQKSFFFSFISNKQIKKETGQVFLKEVLNRHILNFSFILPNTARDNDEYILIRNLIQYPVYKDILLEHFFKHHIYFSHYHFLKDYVKTRKENLFLSNSIKHSHISSLISSLGFGSSGGAELKRISVLEHEKEDEILQIKTESYRLLEKISQEREYDIRRNIIGMFAIAFTSNWHNTIGSEIYDKITKKITDTYFSLNHFNPEVWKILNSPYNNFKELVDFIDDIKNLKLTQKDKIEIVDTFNKICTIAKL